MLRIGASSHGESQVCGCCASSRRGDRHDARDLTVSCRFEGDFSAAFVTGRSEGLLPGETFKNLVHATARAHAGAEIERFGLALCDRLLDRSSTRHACARRDRRAAVDAPRGRRQAAGTGVPREREPRAAHGGHHQQRQAESRSLPGIDQLTIMRTAGLAPARSRPSDEGDPSGLDDGLQRLLVAMLSARWTYSSAGRDVRSLPSGRARRDRRDVRLSREPLGAAHALRDRRRRARVVRGDQPTSRSSLQERPYRPADLFSDGVENPDDLFVAVEEPVGVVEVTVERHPPADPPIDR